MTRIVWQSFEGQYSDNPRVLFERWRTERPQDKHVWLADPRAIERFPVDVDTVAIYTPDCVAALEQADVVVANTHTDVDWAKTDATYYVQTWHGTPLKRIHRDVLWAPPGRLDRLSRDVARWDLLVSPNAASTPRLRGAFEYGGEVTETGYPRNDLLNRADRDDVRRRVRAAYGIADDVRVLLYTPTWRDDVVFADEAPIALELDPEVLLKQLDPGTCLLVRAHPFVAGRLALLGGDNVIDASAHGDVAELYLAADAMITDYSSTMFDFAVTGKPIVFFVYDMERFGDTTRGFYFDLAAEAPGPLARTQDELAAALHDLPALAIEYADAASRFRERYCALEDGGATSRVLSAILART
jgi:CDP-glycerol glycerophosphotransferase